MSNTFKQFCIRKWLDHCDENKTAHSLTYTADEYKKEFNKELLKMYAKETENT